MTQKIDPLLSLYDVAKALRLSPMTVREYVRRGKLRAVRGHPDLGSPMMIRRSDLLRYLKNRCREHHRGAK